VIILCSITALSLQYTSDDHNNATLGFDLNALLVCITTIVILIPGIVWLAKKWCAWEEKKSPSIPFQPEPDTHEGPEVLDILRNAKNSFLNIVTTVKNL
jgi:hypothetical protein